jgi:tRNA A-37 threonylcarbamoyl transferase component Bud32
LLTQIEVPELNLSKQFLCLCRQGHRQRAPLLGRRHHKTQSLMLDHTPSTLAHLVRGEAVLKMIKARSWHEYVKTWWGHSRLFKEVKGNHRLKSLGLNVAEIFEIGFKLIPDEDRYIGYYIMQDLESVGASEAYSELLKGNISGRMRSALFNRLVKELRKMREFGIVFSDCHLKNIFVKNNGEIIWIDTGVTCYLNPKGKRFKKKFNYSIERFAGYHNNPAAMNAEESELIRSLLI